MGLFGGKKAVDQEMTVAKSVPLIQDVNQSPAVSLDKIRAAGVDLAKKTEKAGISLSKRGLAGIRAQAVLILDHSGSMRSDYKSGAVQQLVERTLGFALQIDIDGTIPVIPFDTRVWPTVDVTLGNYQDVVDREIYRTGKMGTTNLADAMSALVGMAEESDAPLFAIVVTDGSPNSKRDATRVVCELSRYPVFIKFLAIRPVDYLQELDDLPDSRRLLDNVDAKYISDPAGMTDLAFADAMADEWDSWIRLATQAGVLR